MLRVKQCGIKYHFLSLWYNSTRDGTPVFQTIGEHSTHQANGLPKTNPKYLLPGEPSSKKSKWKESLSL